MSTDIERKLISRLTSNKDILRVWEMGLRPEVFEEPINRRVFEWMIDFWQENQMQSAPTWVVMEKEFPAVQLVHNVEEPTEWLVDYLQRRWMINQGQDIIRTAVTTLSEDPVATIGNLWRSAYNITEAASPRLARADLSQNVLERRESYSRKRDQQEIGMTLGLDEMDEHTRGILPGELAVVAAYTKTGKSFWMANAAVQARRKGYTPLMMTLEQSVEEMTERIDAYYSRVSYHRLQRGDLRADEAPVLIAAREEMAELGPFYVEKPQRGERTVKNMASRCRQLGADYLIIDQLSFIDGEREYRGDKATTQKHSDLIFDLKDEINRESSGRIPCLLAVQFNRETMRDKSAGGKGELFNFAHSSMIEQTADLCLALHRTSEMRINNTMGVSIIGARRVDKREWTLSWNLGNRSEISVRQPAT